MLHRLTLGRIPAKPHTTFHDEDGRLLMEQMVTRQGFEGPYSILYYRTPPTDEFEVSPLKLPGFCPFELVKEQPLHRRHIKTQDLRPAGDYLTGRRTLMANRNLQIGLAKPCEPAGRFFSNGDGDELYFVNEGSGFVESVYGLLPFRRHDYVLIPKGTAYRLHLEGDRGTLLVFEGRPWLGIPGEYRNRWGQITDFAPYSHRDFRVPTELLAFDAKKHKVPFELVVKQADELSVHRYQHFPLDVVGWDGVLYPVAFSIHDYQPKTGLVHLPPTIHTTFAGEGFVVCSFVPRKVDYFERGDSRAIPCPYAHSSVDMDEILYYVEGNFTSRRGISSESISLHPQGVTHGPHPGTYQRSVGTERTDELAVMCDTYEPLRLTTTASGVEDKDYHLSWVRHESPGDQAWTSK
ncbi:MAG: homogentisate 1,2-dioxygenase [Phycisphaerae bacterium]|nr:homogentisate 1,2-dioxygenase [Phycisphaerae bacterium]MCZ2401372.1 homogentisate 1,2-dioxygenase [Phycisphaerae bacterium]NUQ49128.1 homogentisate 1,2-dioxygenase [Phycisphaerae bacterium]